MAGTSNSITTHNVLNGVLNADNVISGLVNTAFNPAYALVTQAGAQIVLFINSSDYKMYAQLKDKSGNLIYTSNIIDLPLETMVVDGRYDSGTKKLILVLDNGNEIEVPLGALISGLVNENDLVANYYDKDEIDVLLDGYWTKIELTQEDIDNWNAKQEYLNQGDGIEISADTILKGNTYQESTTGKNLLKNTNVNSGDNNYWNSYSIYDEETGTLTRSTTETTESFISHRINLKNDTKYTISCLAKSNGYVRSLDIYAYNSTTTKIYSKADISLTTNFQKYSFTFTTDSTDFTNSTIRFDNNGSTQSGTEAILTIKDVMLAEGEDTEFEPYTNGASPNPDYPQDIHVVSGDNSINVCGKNLYNPQINVGTYAAVTYSVASDGLITQSASDSSSWDINQNRIFYLNAGTYTIKIIGTFRNLQIRNLTDDEDIITTTNDTYTFTLNNKKALGIKTYGGTITYPISYYIEIVKGDVAPTTYEPYIGNTYPVNLPIENLWHLDNATNNGVTLTNNDDGSITLNGTCTSTNQFRTTFDTPLSSDTYTLSFVSSVALSTGSLYVRTRNSNGVLAQNLDVKVTSANQTITSDIKYLDITIVNGVTYNNVNLKIQFEKGSKANSYTPYGTTPIELCKIGTYQDIIKKSTGKNLAREEFESKYSLTGSRDNRTVAVAIYKISEIIEVQPNTTYTISGTFTDFADNVIRIAMFDNLPTTGSISTKYISSASSPYTFITDTNTKYILIWNSGGAGDTIIHKLQLEKGSQATSFEPYGIGWYVKKEIGKVVFTGGNDETWNISETSTSGSNRFLNESIANLVTKPSASSVTINTLSNNFVAKSANQTYLNQEGIDISSNGNLHIYSDTTKNYTVAQFETWLSTHNTIVYYPLATPTYTEITDSTLISQLNALIIGFSNNWVENVSQTNADLPFEIEYDNKNLTISASSNLVRNTDYATSNTGGVIKIGYYNFNISEGRPYVTTTSYADYQNLGNGAFIGKGTLENVITGKALETTNNKVTSISSSSTDTQYPSAKCVYDLIGNLETILTTLDIGTGVE